MRRSRPWLLLPLLFPSVAVAGVRPAPPAPQEAAPEEPAAEKAPDLEQRLGAALADWVEERGLPGATLAVVLPDGRELSLAAGFADVEAEVPMQPGQLLLGGSTGKTWVAALTLLAVHEGRLRLDSSLVDFFGRRWWFQFIPNGRSIRVKHLLRHESGIPEYVLQKAFLDRLKREPFKVYEPEEVLFFVFGKEALFPVGEGWSYADTNYILLGMILEEIGNDVSFYDQVRLRLMEPHGFTDTVPSTQREIPGLAAGYTNPGSPFGVPEKTLDEEGRFAINPQFEWCGGGYATTSPDLARWARVLFRGEAFEGEYLDTLLDAVPANTGRGHRYGHGAQVVPTRHGVLHGHSGYFPGYLTAMGYLPDHELALAIQVNTDRLDLVGRPLFSVLETFAGEVLAEAAPVGGAAKDEEEGGE